MAVKLNQHDLEFILKQIKIGEAHANGTALTEIRLDSNGEVITDRAFYTNPANATLIASLPLAIPDPKTPFGIRTVDGSYNNLLEGRELWGAADQIMPRLLDPNFINDADGDRMPFGGPTAPVVTNNDYGTVGTPNQTGANGGHSGNVADADPRIISNLIVDMSVNNPAAVTAWFNNPLAVEAWMAANPGFEPVAPGDVTNPLTQREITNEDLALIPNIAPDEGISASFNAWMTFFGQFFDHGLDLITKGGNGTIYIPLQPDDPLYVEGGNTNFMVVTRATPVVGNGPDGVANTEDDTIDHINTTTPFVDQNQTYTSHPSHQVFLREYTLDADGRPVATGKLLDGSGGGLPTWLDVKTQALDMLGLRLSDAHVHEVPLLATDPYGMFERGPNGFAQVLVAVNQTVDGTTTTTMVKVEGTEAGLDLTNITLADLPADFTPTAGATIEIVPLGTRHAFLDDIAHNAVPGLYDTNGDRIPDSPEAPDTDTEINDQNVPRPNGTYDNELLDRHFITGDGRGNENIALSTVHHVFHSEHNRLIEANKANIIEIARAGNIAFLNEWLIDDVQAVPADLDTLVWDGERIFQAARFGTEMQYQHLVFEEFGRKIQPAIDVFVFNSVTDINPAIFAEFANTVYRFGHSMLTENMPRVFEDGTSDDMGLIGAFLNPVAFNTGPGDALLTSDQAAAAVVRGMTREHANEIDEFVVGALRNNLLGLPLDLAAINIARGRDTGVPTLNEARQELYAASGSSFLKPYESWAEFAANLKTPASVINFLAAYGTHSTLTDPTVDTLAEKRAAAELLVFGGDGAPADRLDFLNGRGGHTAESTGLNAIDLWIGGLAEKILLFGGMLGSTFNAIFELQMENLQDADRFYYLTRTQGLHFLDELENNAFSKMIIANTSLSQPGPDGIRGTSDDIVDRHIGIDSFGQYDYVLEVNSINQDDYNGAEDGVDPLGGNDVLEAIGLGKVVRTNPDGSAGNYLRFTGGEHVVLGGTNDADTLIGDLGDDAIWGEGGDDFIEGGQGVDLVMGGAGDDIILDAGDVGDFLKGDEGNDVIANSNGLDVLMGGDDKDAIFVGVDDTEVFGGEGDDFILGGDGMDFLLGNEGDDWMEAGRGFDTTAGDNSELFFNSTIIGHDVMFAGSDEHDFDAESGDDIMVQGESVMRNEGMFGFDWATFQGANIDGYADMRIRIFTTEEQDILRNRFDKVEALSGWERNDTLIGDDRVFEPLPPNPTVGNTEGVFFNDALDQAGLARIDGLDAIVDLDPVTGRFEHGNVLLGGAGSDTITGMGGDDIIDGDRWLNVRISIRDAGGNEIDSVTSMRHVFPTNHPQEGWGGRSLFELLVDRTLSPTQLHIVREVITDGVDNEGDDRDIDTAVFNDIRANYTIVTNADGSLTVSQVAVSDAVVPEEEAAAAVSDGTDTLHNIEFLQFADGTVSAADIFNQPFDALNIVFDEPTGALVATPSEAPPAGVTVAYAWQVLLGGVWTPIQGETGDSFIPSVAETGLEVRVVASYDGGSIASVETAIVGDDAANEIDGTTRANIIIGLAGDDRIAADAGNDFVHGGDGDDELDGGDGDDTIRGGLGNDNLIGRTGNNFLFGDENDDTLAGGHGNDTLDGGTGIDTVTLDGPREAFSFTVDGDAVVVTDNLGAEGGGVDRLIGIEQLQFGEEIVLLADAVNAFFGTAGDDTITGGPGANQLIGLAGNDTYEVNHVGDQVIEAPNQGTDTVLSSVDFTLSANVENLTLTGASAINGTGNELDNRIVGNGAANTLSGGAGVDNILGGAGNDLIDGGVGNDNLSGDDGDDTINGGAGDDLLLGGAGDDNLSGDDATAGTDTLFGGAGNDTLTGGLGRDAMSGEDGNDTFLWRAYEATATQPQGFTDGREIIDGGAGTDHVVLTGSSRQETFVIWTRQAWLASPNAGSEPLHGDTEIIIQRATPNFANIVAIQLRGIEEITINGGPGTALGGDTFELRGDFTGTSLSTSTVTLNGSPLADLVDLSQFASGHRVVVTTSDGDDIVLGGRGIDQVSGGAGNDNIAGGNNDDTLNGDAGDDNLDGGNDTDTLAGGAGNDTLTGGLGRDTMSGGDGDDSFIWNAYEPTTTRPFGFTDGREIIDGGAGTDTFIANGSSLSESFIVWTRDAWEAAPLTTDVLHPDTEIVVTRTTEGFANTVVIQLRDIQEIVLNGTALSTTPPPTNPIEGDTFELRGDFTQTSLSTSTVTINGTPSNDRIDISQLESSHRIVVKSSDGNDIILGNLRPQDVVELPAGKSLTDYTEMDNEDGSTTLWSPNHSVTFFGTPHVGRYDEEDDGPLGTYELDEEDYEDILGMIEDGLVRDASGLGNNEENPSWGAADHNFIRLTDPHYTDGADGIRETALNPREISDILANQDNDGDGYEESIPNEFGGTSLLTFFGQYFDHGLDFVAKGNPGSVPIGTEEFPISAPRSNIVAGTGVDPDGVPNNGNEIPAEYVNHASTYADQNQAYGSHEAITEVLRQWVEGPDGPQQTAYLLGGDLDSTGRALLPTLDHIRENYRIMTGGDELTSTDIFDFDGSGQPLLIDFIPVFVTLPDGTRTFELDLDAIGHYFVAGDGRANENVMLTSIHTIWARNHNFWVDKIKEETGGTWTEEEYFQAARMMNVAEYQQVVFTEFATAMAGGLDDGIEHGFEGYDPTVDASISVEFAQAAYRYGHSMVNETVSYLDEDGNLQEMSLVEAFLKPETVSQMGIDSLLGGSIQVKHEGIDVDVVNALRNQLVGRPLDLAALNIFRGRDMGIAPFNEVRAQLFEKTGLASLRPYEGWDDFQERNEISDSVMAQLKAAYPEGFHTVDLWVGGLVEKPRHGQLGSTFGYIFLEQLDRLQHGDRLYYLEVFDDSIFEGKPATFANIIMRNTDLTGLPEDVFQDGTIQPVGDGLEAGDQEVDDTSDQENDEDSVAGDDNAVGGDEVENKTEEEDEETEAEDEGETLAPTANASATAGDEGEDLAGTSGADAIMAGAGDDRVVAGDGDDDLFGGAGADMLFGENGNDRLFGGDDDDHLEGGAGNDTVFGGAGDDVIVAKANDGDDVYYGDEMDGSVGNDTLDMAAITANVTADLGTGFLGRGHVASGASGSDTLWGIENIVTGSGDDTITASGAVNVIDAGGGDDIFRFLSTGDADGDTIASFEAGDQIDLSGIDANDTAGGSQAFLVSAAFTGVAGQLLVTQMTIEGEAVTLVEGDTGGNGEADFRITVKGSHELTSSDFNL